MSLAIFVITLSDIIGVSFLLIVALLWGCYWLCDRVAYWRACWRGRRRAREKKDRS